VAGKSYCAGVIRYLVTATSWRSAPTRCGLARGRRPRAHGERRRFLDKGGANATRSLAPQAPTLRLESAPEGLTDKRHCARVCSFRDSSNKHSQPESARTQARHSQLADNHWPFAHLVYLYAGTTAIVWPSAVPASALMRSKCDSMQSSTQPL